MHLQFIGLPASGKTTIVETLVKKHPDRFVKGEKRYNSVSKLLLYNPVLFIKSIWRAKSVLWICLQSVQVSKVSKKNKILAILGLLINLSNYNYSLKIAKKDHRVTLWDELILQRALSIFAYSDKLPSEKKVIKFIKWSKIHCKALPIVVHLDNQQQSIRLFERGVPNRMKSLKVSTIEEIINVQHQALQLIINELHNYQLIDSSLDLNKNLDQIISFSQQSSQVV